MAPALIPAISVGHIDDVQELRKTKPSHIPQRFVRDRTERPRLSTINPPSCKNIPVIDLSKLQKGNKDEFQAELLQLSASCEDWGFFQVYDILSSIAFLFILVITGAHI